MASRKSASGARSGPRADDSRRVARFGARLAAVLSSAPVDNVGELEAAMCSARLKHVGEAIRDFAVEVSAQQRRGERSERLLLTGADFPPLG